MSSLMQFILLVVLVIVVVLLFMYWRQRSKPAVPPASQKVEKPEAVKAPVTAPAVQNVAATASPDIELEAFPMIDESESETLSEADEDSIMAGRLASFETATQGDDLTIIEGIGPKIASMLQAAGVTTFAQLAEMEPENISEILRAAGHRLADPQSWPEQARLAAAGEHEKLHELQGRLRAGRSVS